MHFFLCSFLSGRAGAMQILCFLSTSELWDKKLPLSTLTSPWLKKFFRYQSKMNFFLLQDKTLVINFAIQIKDQTKWWENIKRSMVSGVSKTISKSLLVSEVRRIMPTVAGLPLQLSLFTAAVTAADVTGGQKPRTLKL